MSGNEHQISDAFFIYGDAVHCGASSKRSTRRAMMIKGKKVRLRPVEKTDLPKIWEWLNDEEVMYYWASPDNTVSLAQLEHQFLLPSEPWDPRGTPARQILIIETIEGVAIGQIGYFDLSTRHRRAEVLTQIGEKDYWGKGYGTDAMMSFLNYLFNELGLNRVYLYTQSYNRRAYASYKKCGFVEEGVARQRYFVNGEYHDGFLMSVLRHEFNRRAGLEPAEES